MTREELVKLIEKRLLDKGFESSRFEAQQIAEMALRCDNAALVAEQMTEKRLSHYPLQYILGEWEFYGLPILVGDGVLIPRQDTETVVDVALNLLKGQKSPTVFDICAGSGCIGIALAKKLETKAYFFEKSEKALQYLKKNIALNKIDGEILACDALKADLEEFQGTADIIVSNPPYIKSAVVPTLDIEVGHEPKMALDGGDDGLVFYKAIAEKWKQSLKKNGIIVFEIGFDQADEVAEILQKNGYKNIKITNDLCGNPRVVSAQIC